MLIDDLRAMRAQEARFGFGQALASDVTPDEAAEDYRAMKEFGVPNSAVTRQQRITRDSARIDWTAGAQTQPVLQRRLADLGFANLVKDDVERTGWLETLFRRVGGEPGEAANVGQALRNSGARGLLGLENVAPVIGNEARMRDLSRQLRELDEAAKRLANGESNAEIWGNADDPSGIVGRTLFDRYGEVHRKRIENEMRRTAAAMAWVGQVQQYYPQSAAGQALADADTLGEALAAVAENPVGVLADIGPEAVVQMAPFIAASLVTGGSGAVGGLIARSGTQLSRLAAMTAGAGRAASITNIPLMGANSFGLSVSSNMLEAAADQGIDLTNPEALYNFYHDNPNIAEMEATARRYGSAVAAFDALSLGLASARLPLTLPSRLAKVAPAASRTYARAMNAPMVSAFSQYAAQGLLQASLGATGEAAGQLVAEGEVTSWSDIVSEFIGEFTTSPIEVSSVAVSSWRAGVDAKARAQANEAQTHKLIDDINQSKLAERSPEALNDYLNDVERDAYDRSPFYVQADVLKQEGVAEQLSAASPEFAAELEAASQLGADVRLSYPQFAKLAIEDPELAHRLAPYMHRRGDKTQAEADAALRDLQVASIDQVSRSLTRRSEPFQQAMRNVGYDIGRMLNAVPDNERSRNEKKAVQALWMTQVSNAAQDMGMDPVELWRTFGVKAVLGRDDVAMDEQGNLQLFSPAAKAAYSSGEKSQRVDLYQATNGFFDPVARVIALLPTANASTLLHEGAHAFLELRMRLVTSFVQSTPDRNQWTDSQRSFVEITERLVRHYGMKSLDDFNAAPRAARRSIHERFARDYERYLYEGHAPASGLARVFQQFSNWLRSVYRTIVEIPNGKMTDDTRALFDALFVSAEEQEKARWRRSFYDISRRLQQAVDDPSRDKLINEFVNAFKDSEYEATAQLQAKMMRDQAYISRLRQQTVKKFTNEQKRLRSAYYKEAFERLSGERRYQAFDYLHDTEKFLESDLQAYGYAQDHIDALRSKGLVTKRRRNRASPPIDEVANRYGFTSVDELVTTMERTQSAQDEANDIADARMIEEHGELSSPEAIERAADSAIFNASTERMFAIAADFLDRASGRSAETVEAADAVAHAFIEGMRGRDLDPRGARKAAEENVREALRAMADSTRQVGVSGSGAPLFEHQPKDLSRAASLMRRSVFNAALARVIEETRAKFAQRVRTLRQRYDGKETNKNMDHQVFVFIANALGQVGICNNIITQETVSYDDLAKHFAQTYGQTLPLMPPAVARMLGMSGELMQSPIEWRDATVNQRNEFLDFISHLESQGRDSKVLLTTSNRESIDDVNRQIAEGVIDSAKERGREARVNAARDGWRAKLDDDLTAIAASHQRVPTLLQAIDGSRDGLLYKYVIKPFRDAQTRETQMTQELGQKLLDAFKPLKKALSDHKSVYRERLGGSYSASELVVMLFNLGSESSTIRLLDGSTQDTRRGPITEGPHPRWELADVLLTIGETLSKEQIAAVQGVWDVYSSLWPQVVALEREMGNPRPEQVRPRPIQLRASDGSLVLLQGGYYPAVYDYKGSDKAEIQDIQRTGLEAFTGLGRNLNTNKSHVQRRAGSGGGRPLLLIPAGGINGLTAVIHDLCWRKPLIDANKIFTPDGRVMTAIKTYWGQPAVKAINSWLERLARNGLEPSSTPDKMADLLRRHASVAGLGFNVLTAISQIVGLTQTVAVLGPRATLAGISEFISRPRAAQREMLAKSAFMRQRGQTFFRELRDVNALVTRPGSGWQTTLTNWAYAMIVYVQALVDIPTWYGAYSTAIADGKTDVDAVAWADNMVAQAQGSGQLMDLSMVESHNSWTKLFTTFYQFFNVALNAAAYSMTTEKGARRWGSILLLMAVQPILDTFLRSAFEIGGDDDEDYDEKLDKMFRKALAAPPEFVLNSMVGLRELSGISAALAGDPILSWRGPSGARVITDTYRLAQQINQGEMDQGLLKAINSLSGSLLGNPFVVPLNRAIEGGIALDDDETENPLSLVLGYKGKN